MLHYLILLAIAILPVAVLMVFIYRQDKYQKEPVKSLIKAFVGGIIAIPLVILLVSIIDVVLEETAIGNTVFFSSFLEAGIPEELAKFLVFMIFIWRDKNFDEYFDGIVYATFISLGFACVENIIYVFQYGFATGIVRALFSVPGHFLFGVVMGYFLSLAKFHSEKSSRYLLTGLLLAMLAHGLFDWLLLARDVVDDAFGAILYIIFLGSDIFLWRLGIKYIRKQQENSRVQAGNAPISDEIESAPTKGYASEYKHIDWNAGNQQ